MVQTSHDDAYDSFRLSMSSYHQGWELQKDEKSVTGTGQDWYYHWKAEELTRCIDVYLSITQCLRFVSAQKLKIFIFLTSFSACLLGDIILNPIG